MRIGFLIPSSNTVAEPMIIEMLSSIPQIGIHFSRLSVTQIALSGHALAQFDHAEILKAATLLSHAKVSVIVWCGTSAGWLGFDHDEKLCETITQSTGIPSTTSILALRKLFQENNLSRIGLVTPYTNDVQTDIIENWTGAGFECTAERHLNIQDNFAFSEVSEAALAEMTRDVASRGCDAVTILCTNLRGARIAAKLERELNIPIYDTVSTAVWHSLLVAGFDHKPLKGWGSIFE